MIDSNPAVGSLGNVELLAATREILRRSCVVEADLLVHFAEIEERRLHSEMAFPTMFAFCVDELGFSEDQAWNRTTVARAARRIPAMLDSLRSGAVHLTGLRLLARCLTEQNHRDLLAEAAGKSKRQIEEIVARLDPKPPVPDSFRKRPVAKQVTLEMRSPVASPSAPRREQRAVVAPLSEDTFTVQFTASRALRDKFRRAQDLLRHRVPSGDIAAIFDKALDSLIEKVEKERFAAVGKPRTEATEVAGPASSRQVPAAIRRHVYARDSGRCTFVDARGHRCKETGMLEFDHLDGFARTHLHDPERIVLRCSGHNQHAAEKMYGREFIERARAKKASPSTAVDSVSQQPLFAPQGPELVEAKSRSAQPGR
ncbi:MAG: HNH endonuclease [Myxococcales bacterium]